MSKVYQLKVEQLLNLRNNLIISEALEDGYANNAAEDVEMADDYNDLALKNVNTEPPEDVTPEEKTESSTFGEITKGLYNYAHNYNLSHKIADAIQQENHKISAASASEFIEKLLYGIYRMSQDPAQNVAFDRFLRSIGVTLDGELLTTQ